ncbi:MAG: tyrosine-type recombinase/integrase [Clostridia bacterium]|nr:tyrosine-type recombinase/integrase [Clostridia bacterium]
MMDDFRQHLLNEERAEATISKYLHDVEAFRKWLGQKEAAKQTVLEYKRMFLETHSPASVNSMLSSLNMFFKYSGKTDLMVKLLKIQRNIFADKEKELSKAEYEKLLRAAKSKNNERLYLLMQTICSTGIRVSELKFITVEAIKLKEAQINCKGKHRKVLLPQQLCKILSRYVKERKIQSGSIFVTRSGKPLDRSNICHDMKKLCDEAGVLRGKVFPHNLRHLFARTYYSIEKDIVRLADILGHSGINTTRIYTMETGDVHRVQIQRLGLLIC